MRLRCVLLVGCLAPLAGCHLARNIARNAYNEPTEILDEVHVERQLRREAKAAFGEVKRQFPRRSFCDDFDEGFVDGYSDFLNSGGKADMPAMPPLKYRKAKFLNPEGHARIKDYFLGFKYGMDVAVATGCRPFYTVPILVSEPSEQPPLNITVLPPPPDANAPMPKLGSPLPLPRDSKPKEKPEVNGSPTFTPGLGNPVIPKPTDSNSVPIPSGAIPKPVSPATPPGPGGKSAFVMPFNSGEIVTVSGLEFPPIPEAGTSGPILNLPPASPPMIDLPAGRSFHR